MDLDLIILAVALGLVAIGGLWWARWLIGTVEVYERGFCTSLGKYYLFLPEKENIARKPENITKVPVASAPYDVVRTILPGPNPGSTEDV